MGSMEEREKLRENNYVEGTIDLELPTQMNAHPKVVEIRGQVLNFRFNIKTPPI